MTLMLICLVGVLQADIYIFKTLLTYDHLVFRSLHLWVVYDVYVFHYPHLHTNMCFLRIWLMRNRRTILPWGRISGWVNCWLPTFLPSLYLWLWVSHRFSGYCSNVHKIEKPFWFLSLMSHTWFSIISFGSFELKWVSMKLKFFTKAVLPHIASHMWLVYNHIIINVLCWFFSFWFCLPVYVLQMPNDLS